MAMAMAAMNGRLCFEHTLPTPEKSTSGRRQTTPLISMTLASRSLRTADFARRELKRLKLP
jgi:hypothetical protein